MCVGGGLGGLAGALAAARNGLDAVVLEKSALLGGVGAYSGGVVWAPCNDLARHDSSSGFADSPELARAYVEFLSGGAALGHHDGTMRDALLGNVARVVRQLCELGARFSVIGIADQYFPDAPGSAPFGRAIEAELGREGVGPWAEVLRLSPFFPPGRTIREELSEARAAARPVERATAAQESANGPEPVPPRLTRGAGLIGWLVRLALVERAVPCVLSCPVVELCYDGRQVTGVVVEHRGERRTVSARRGVLIATGSYGYAPWAAPTEGLPAIAEQAPPVITGDALLLAEPTPAAVVRAGLPFITLGYRSSRDVHRGSEVPLHYPVYEFLGLPHGLVVNARGNRFGDESFYGTFGGAISRYDSTSKTFPNYPAFLVVDDDFRRRYGAVSAAGHWPEEEMTGADDLTALAAAVGIDPDGLSRTVERFNQFARAGIDTDFGRGSLEVARRQYGDPDHAPNPNLGEVERPPFWALRLEIVGVGVYSHGFRIDGHARVLSRRGAAVDGLYATGNAVAYADVPYGYENGLANARNLVYATLAAEHAAGACHPPS